MKRFDLFCLIVVSALLGLALCPFPYGYYTFLRLAVCAYGIYLIVLASQKERQWVIVFSLAIVLLYNPLFKVHLVKSIWSVLNVVTIAVFAAACILLFRKKD